MNETAAQQVLEHWLAIRAKADAKVKRVAKAIEDAIVVECHTWTTKQLDYMAAARAAIREAANDDR